MGGGRFNQAYLKQGDTDNVFPKKPINLQKVEVFFVFVEVNDAFLTIDYYLLHKLLKVLGVQPYSSLNNLLK